MTFVEYITDFVFNHEDPNTLDDLLLRAIWHDFWTQIAIAVLISALCEARSYPTYLEEGGTWA